MAEEAVGVLHETLVELAKLERDDPGASSAISEMRAEMCAANPSHRKECEPFMAEWCKTHGDAAACKAFNGEEDVPPVAEEAQEAAHHQQKAMETSTELP